MNTSEARYQPKVFGVLNIESLGRMFGIAEDARDRVGASLEQVVAHDQHDQARGADILLGARVDQAEPRDVQRPRQDVRGHVGNQRHVADIGNLLELDAMNGLVRRVVDIARASDRAYQDARGGIRV